jgi:predicted DNA-binding transcriptional regulator AlpA
MTPQDTIRKVLNTHQAAEYVGLSASTLEKLRLSGGGPCFIKLGKRVAYHVDDLDSWLAANRRRSTSDQCLTPTILKRDTRDKQQSAGG